MGELDVYRLIDDQYEKQTCDENQCYWIEEMGLFLGVWQGKKAEMKANWLRWWDKTEDLLLWGGEQVEQERQRAEQAEIELEQEKRSSQRLAQKLREMGVDPDVFTE